MAGSGQSQWRGNCKKLKPRTGLKDVQVSDTLKILYGFYSHMLIIEGEYCSILL